MDGEWAGGYKASYNQNKLAGTSGGLINKIETGYYLWLLFFYIFISHALVYQNHSEKATLYRILEHLLWPTHCKIQYLSMSVFPFKFMVADHVGNKICDCQVTLSCYIGNNFFVSKNN